MQYHLCLRDCVQYLTADLKKVQYYQSVTDCIQYLMLDLEESTVPPELSREAVKSQFKTARVSAISRDVSRELHYS